MQDKEEAKLSWSSARAVRDRIIFSNDFANKAKSLDILKYVFRKWPGVPESNLHADTEVSAQYSFPLEQLFQPGLYDDQVNDVGAIYKQLANMSEYLEEFYSNDPLQGSLKLSIEVKSTNVTFHIVENLRTEDYLGKFWEPYSEGSRDNNKLLLSESWFWRNENHVYVRNFFENNPTNADWLSELGGIAAGAKFHAGLFYVATGQVWAALELSSFFTQKGIKLSVAPASQHPTPWTLRGLNVIMLGNSRTNSCYARLQQNWRALRLAGMSVVEHFADGNQAELCVDDSAIIGPDRHYYALLTRCPNVDSKGVITALVANHGHAAQAAMEFLTGPNVMSLFEALRGKGWRPTPQSLFPSCFQVVFDVTVQTAAKGDETINVSLCHPRVPRGTSLPETARSA